MVQIISKTDRSHNEDNRLKQFVAQNRGTIEKIADTITGGALGARARRTEVAVPEPATRVGFKATSSEGNTQPYVRISINGRVVVVDYNTGRQLHHIGDVRGTNEAGHLVLATVKNGFCAPLDESLYSKLNVLDGVSVIDRASEEALKVEISSRLGFTR